MAWFKSALSYTANKVSETVSAMAMQVALSNAAGAVPFNGNIVIRRVAKQDNDDDDDDNFVSLRRDDTVSNTLGRFTYQLDSYEKNAMLIFHVSSYEGSYATVAEVKKAFEKFRFEVETYHDITADSLRSICNGFFSRDFSSYGAVAVVILAPVNSAGNYVSQGSVFTNEDILKYFWDPPQTLKSKPKIFISQGDNQIVHASALRPTSMIPEEHHVFELYLPATVYKNSAAAASSSDDNETCHPLSLICHRLEVLGDQKSFQDVVSDTIEEAKTKWTSSQQNNQPFQIKTYNVIKSLNFWRNIN